MSDWPFDDAPGPWEDDDTFPITVEEADTILGWIEILKLAEPRLGYAPQERDLLARMAGWADAPRRPDGRTPR